ncbi:DNA-binding transcriptional regulator [Deinococcus irradiatisoli]|uniref:DNA-binding transcriptional regulator n=1 Tax=Deinococcus irradiatisoli TaxID=2202254 RepID=A0A2Z3JQK0_9DEIO|nr:PLP-dependent aminotransferase family protein [Deinococcus irradiatisoli]AWN23698.1 DNA-binding transcriptional regulator [Deinococcus irradiatisoli]
MTPRPPRGSASRSIGAAALAEQLGDWSGSGAAYRQLAQALRQLILDGRLALGVRLPGERETAAALRLSRTTVAAAYLQLRDEGFLSTRRGSGSLTTLPEAQTLPSLLRPFDPAGSADDGLLDLAYATLPAPEGLHRAYAAALQALPAHLPGHGYAPAGLPVLRQVIAERYAHQGLPTSAEQIVVTFGAQHALSLLVRVLTCAGERVLVDHPTYLHALDTFREEGCQIVPVALGSGGWDLAGLRAAIRQTAPRLAYLIPDFHNPTGHCMPEAQRRSVIEAAHQGRTTLIVDEVLSDLWLDGAAPAPFASFDARAQVVSIGSLSKSFWGGLRLGWMRVPPALAQQVMAARSASDLGAPTLEQLTAAHLLADAGPMLERRRETLRRQRDALHAALGLHLPEWRYHLPQGGLSLWAALPQPVSSLLASTSERFGVRVIAGPRFGTQGQFERHLRLPFTLPETELGEAVGRLARAVRALPQEHHRSAEPARGVLSGV